jgi:TolB-like protein
MSGEEVKIGPFRFDPARRELSREGVPVRLGGRALDILAVLASAKGELVTKDELLAQVWPGRVVEENALAAQVSGLRRVLDEGNSGQSRLVSVSGRGYRLIGLSDTLSGPPLPDKPSIAVLPFQNLSDDPQQDYFADGIVEDIITALSRIRWLFVIARNSSFAYKGRATDVKQVGRELGVRYVLEGSVRKAGARVRLTGQLIDAATNMNLWADRFDGGLEDIFDLQDQIAASVVGAMLPKLEQAEIERARRKPTDSLDAYDYYLRGLASAHRMTREGTSEALRLLARASELDPEYATPHGLAAECYVVRKINGWMSDRDQEIAAAARHARLAAALGTDDAVALAFGACALGFVVGEFDDAVALTDRALALSPNLVIAWFASGMMRVYRGGEPDRAIEHLARAMRLSPLDPFMSRMQNNIALAHFLAGRHEEAPAWAEKAFRGNPRSVGALRVIAASDALVGRPDEARNAIARALALDPEMRLSNLDDRIGKFGRAEDHKKYVEALRLAGLPE